MAGGAQVFGGSRCSHFLCVTSVRLQLIPFRGGDFWYGVGGEVGGVVGEWFLVLRSGVC